MRFMEKLIYAEIHAHRRDFPNPPGIPGHQKPCGKYVRACAEGETIPRTFHPRAARRKQQNRATIVRQRRIEAAGPLAKRNTRRVEKNSGKFAARGLPIDTLCRLIIRHCPTIVNSDGGDTRQRARARAPMALGAIPLFPGVLVIARYIEKLFLATRFAGDRSEWSGISPIDIGAI